MKILFIADVVGVPGRRAVEERLPGLKEELRADFCILNGENLADGVGITPKLADRMLAIGADAITLGNHVWRRGEIAPYLKESDRVIRPANLSARAPGKGFTVVPAANGTDVAVINLLGSLFIGPPIGPFEVVDEVVEEAGKRTPVIVVEIEQFLGQELNGPASLEVSIGRDGLIRKIVLSSTSNGDQETETLELSDFGVRVAAEPPAARTVVDFANA